MEARNRSCTIEHLLNKYGPSLNLEIVTGKDGLQREITTPQAQLPGVSLTGFLDNYISDRLLIFGASEILYLQEIDEKKRSVCLRNILRDNTPAVIVARNLPLPKELVSICRQKSVPLFRTPVPAMALLGKLSYFLSEEFSPTISFQGTFVEVFGVGILLQGDASIGKSEAALGLVDRGHRLIADESITLQAKHDSFLEGRGSTTNRHMVEIRGIGLVNIVQLYGAVCVRDKKSLDLIIKLENWNNRKAYDRLGIEDTHTMIMGIYVPYHLLPVKPGRDVVLLIETIARNHRLKEMGIYGAREFSSKLSLAIAKKQEEVRNSTKEQPPKPHLPRKKQSAKTT